MPGVPDVLITDSQGRFQLIELKNCKTNSVKLSPHQVSFLTANSSSLAWLLVRYTPTSAKDQFFLYSGDQAPEVQRNGLKTIALMREFQIEPILRLIDTHKLGI
tara:strand:- start:37 stop:348 length:312 start_codon:yes stop_codon:yes gene_type:complete